jgi:hypothetical protein
MSSIWFALKLNFSTATTAGFIPFCYQHHHSLNEWTFLGNLSTAKNEHASALLNGDLWMTGGFGWRDAKLQLPRFLFQTLISGSCHSIFN